MMRQKLLATIIGLLPLLTSLTSCTKEDFARSTIVTKEKATPVKVEQVVGCSRFAPPPLDILILYDNSTSLYYFQRNIKSAIRELISSINQFQDFNICIAPLIDDGSTPAYKCQSHVVSLGQNSQTGLNNVGANSVIIDGVTTNVYSEKGFERAFEFLNRNKVGAAQVDQVFRPQAFTVVINVSNGDDTDVCRDGWGNVSECGKINSWSTKLLNFKANMQLKQLRYISVVNSQNSSMCGGTVRYPGTRYQLMSKVIYTAQGLNDDPRYNPDSYDLCNADLNQIFGQIANSINQYKVGHVYNSWPLGDMTGKDPQKLKVWKGSGSSKVALVKDNLTNGFAYSSSLTAKNIREFPAVSALNPEETYAGPFVNLYGSGKVTYPECLYIQKENFAKYYGYIVMNDEPDLAFLKLYINGKEIPQDTVNGWSYLGFKQSIFVLVKSPQDLVPGPVPTENPQSYYRSGYVLKLYGSAVYSDGDQIELNFKKAKQN